MRWGDRRRDRQRTALTCPERHDHPVRHVLQPGLVPVRWRHGEAKMSTLRRYAENLWRNGQTEPCHESHVQRLACDWRTVAAPHARHRRCRMAGEERNNMMNIYTNSYLPIALLGLLWAVAYGVALWLA